MEDLRNEKSGILLRQHFGFFLKVFVAGFMLAALCVVPAVLWFLSAEIYLLKEQVATANDRREKWEEESERQTRLAEHYRDQFMAVTKTNSSFASFTHDDLRDYAYRMVRALRAHIRDQEAIVSRLESDPAKTIEERSSAEWQAGQKCMAQYNVRLKADVLMLRREILSRIPVGNDVDQNGLSTDYWYDSPWNFYGFKRMVADLERIAQLVPVSNQNAKK